MKKLLSLIAIMLMVALSVSSMVFSVSAEGAWDGVTAAPEFASGDGTEASPYIISNGEQLKLLANLINDPTTNAAYNMSFYKLSADIDLGGNLWYRIGLSATPFSGVFDGDGHTISNFLVMETPAALFGNATNSTVKNLKIDYADYFGASDCGAVFVAKVNGNASLTIENCEIGAKVRFTLDSLGKCARVGGFWGDVGSNAIVYAKNCINRGKIIVTNNGGNDASIGGIGGAFRYGRVENCVNLGSIVSACTGEKTQSAGGIIGLIIAPLEENEATIENVINCANVTGYTSCGGVIGSIHSGTANLKLTNAYSFTNHISIYADEAMALGAGTAIGSIRNESQTATISNVYTIAITDLASVGGKFPIEGTNVTNIASIDALMLDSEFNAILSIFGITELTLPVAPEEETEPEVPGVPTTPDDTEETDPEEETNPIEDTKPEETKPDVTEPEVTEPVQTPTTDAPGTEKPAEGGCGSVVAGGLAILGVVSLAGVVLKKRN